MISSFEGLFGEILKCGDRRPQNQAATSSCPFRNARNEHVLPSGLNNEGNSGGIAKNCRLSAHASNRNALNIKITAISKGRNQRHA